MIINHIIQITVIDFRSTANALVLITREQDKNIKAAFIIFTTCVTVVRFKDSNLDLNIEKTCDYFA